MDAVDRPTYCKDTTLYDFYVLFGDNDHNLFSAFIMLLHHKNCSPREFEGGSMLFRYCLNTVVNNSNPKCNIETGGLCAGADVQFQKTLQIIKGKTAQKIGYDIWVK